MDVIADYSNGMNILITNDDGILAPGLSALANCTEDLGRLFIVAPETTQSAAAHSITLTAPLICAKVQLPSGKSGYSVAGRPADCVKLAMVELLPSMLDGEGRPDMVLSGINAGSNIGINVLYSGTVAAAIEAAFFKVPAAAFSLCIKDKIDFDYAGRVARQVLNRLMGHHVMKPGVAINVNIPPVECGWPKGIRVVPQSTQCGSNIFDRRLDPRGRLYFWLTGETGIEAERGTDLAAIGEDYVSVTPLMFDLTNREEMGELKKMVED
jgi:5'-nucleotidase